MNSKLCEIFEQHEWLKTSKNVVHLPMYKKVVEKGKEKEVQLPGLTWAELYEMYVND